MKSQKSMKDLSVKSELVKKSRKSMKSARMQACLTAFEASCEAQRLWRELTLPDRYRGSCDQELLHSRRHWIHILHACQDTSQAFDE